MNTSRKIILLELNEVPWRVLNVYCQKFPDSFIAKTLPLCYKFETHTPDEGSLSPWKTWPTFHRGVNDKKHEIADFNQDLTKVDLMYPPVWSILQKNGVKTGVCGSLHSFPPPKNFRDYVFYIPDPFAQNEQAHPEYIESFQRFNLQMSRESSRNVSASFDPKAALSLLFKSVKLGLRFKTFLALSNQLLLERKSPWIKTRRRTYQMVLAFDIFLKQLKTAKPDFSTFFTNHVASSMHRYWVATFPEDYPSVDIEKEWMDTYKNEIFWTMSIFDQFFKELVQFVNKNPEYKIIVASSMGQAATTADLLKSQLYVDNKEVLFSKLSLEEKDYTTVPCMFPQYNIKVVADKIEAFKKAIDGLTVLGHKVSYRLADDGFFSIDFGQKNIEEGAIELNGKKMLFKEIGLGNLIIEDQSGTTAYHIPEGILLIFDPKDLSLKTEIVKIPSTQVTPGILSNYNVEIPSYMAYSKTPGLS
jgi:hypothetical protein